MRRATAALLTLLPVLGSTSFGVGHVHAASAEAGSSGLHLDHVHREAGHHTHHDEPASDRELVTDHGGRDAITLDWVATQAMPKRVLPCLAAAPLFMTASHVPETGRIDRTDDPLGDPPVHTRPPGRAPPA